MLTQQLNANYKVNRAKKERKKERKKENKHAKEGKKEKKQCNLYHLIIIQFVQSYQHMW
jgi:hypothetical protein